MTPIRIPIGRGGKRRLSARILASQLCILALTGVIGFLLFAFAQRAEIDRAYEKRALAIAQTTAAEPQIRRAMEYGGGGDVVQTVAERIRKASGASYVVVIDLRGIRHSHPDPALIGEPTGDRIAVLDGKAHVGTDQGSDRAFRQRQGAAARAQRQAGRRGLRGHPRALRAGRAVA